MKQTKSHPWRASLCRSCRGTGHNTAGGQCPVCGGSGRVMIQMTCQIDIKPYKPQ